jgi:2-dehydro-3-deoxyphosphogluconate aldolase / (4S)-4-hydroxy-2-oxoglutarate aldolase
MTRFTRLQVYGQMLQEGMVPVFYHADPEVCRQVLTCCHKAGLRFFEFTNRGDYAHELFSDLNKWTAREFPDLIMGTGSVMDAATAVLYMQLGSNFIVSPLLDEGTAKACNRRKVAWIPGTGSVTEISRAEELGAEIIKVFPGGAVGGPKFVAAVKGPMPWVSLMPTSGVEVTEESIKTWFGAGVVCVGLGSQLFTKELLKAKNWDQLTSDIYAATQLVKKYKSL